MCTLFLFFSPLKKSSKKGPRLRYRCWQQAGGSLLSQLEGQRCSWESPEGTQSTVTFSFIRMPNKMGFQTDDDQQDKRAAEDPVWWQEGAPSNSNLARYRCPGICQQVIGPTAGLHRWALRGRLCWSLIFETSSSQFFTWQRPWRRCWKEI